MFSLKNKRDQRGFTIVELLIVIVVIGILAALVVTTYGGIQAKARDSKRQTDIQALQTQIEAFYATNNYYPNLTDINNATWRAKNMKSLSTDTMTDPSGTSSTLVTTAAASGNKAYTYSPTGCDTTAPSDDTGSTGSCTGYTVSAWLESSSKAYSKQALNQ